MIHHAIDTINNKLNTFLQLKLGDADMVVQESLVTQSGTTTPSINNKVVLSLVNMEEDRVSRTRSTNRPQLNSTIATVRPEIRFNLYLLFSAHFPSSQSVQNYNEGLKALAGVVSFFQSNNLFDHKNTADLPSQIEKLVVEHYSLSLEQQNHLWGALGAKYLPSIMYKIRLLIFQEEEIYAGGAPIQTIDINSQGSNL